MILLHQLLRQHHKTHCSPKSNQHMTPGHLLQMEISLTAHHQYQKNINIRLTAGKAVGEMKSMPDKIQHIDGKAGKEKQQQNTVNRLFLP